jgi:agmatinase
MMDGVEPVGIGRPTFLGGARRAAGEGLRADVAVLGIPHTPAASLDDARMPCAPAPDAVRAASLRWADRLQHHDFDLGGPLFAGLGVRVADLGDVAGQPGRYADNAALATAAVAASSAGGAFPLVLGGDLAALIPTARALDGRGAVALLHLGADLGWCDEAGGERDGRASALRRSAALPHVAGMLQVGLRGLGDARPEDVEAARAFGSRLARADDVRDAGIGGTLARLPRADGYLVSLDLSALDPSIAPGVVEPRFGGLTYREATGLLRELARRGRVVGMVLSGIVPERDPAGLTALLGAQLAVNLLAALAHAGQLGPRPIAAAIPAPGR